ncbi:hypothetical protein BIY24_13690 [Halobacteriovorax marinus]|uniref:Uncharacterized protein n=1 Tax=Halobacteriovorax marinus (strain ATCC BAA-682 / DSM 15412 / SJ) TaxID=862908 RepID=E1WYN1_HALMS|nr:hypothetical protein [Halobacteriovorax marinus]ATH08961.1 hypothetical protein BIY24_13690 [Halobacteriovorax marinus]CBW27671.1 hypothetical protein BMS_2900 [Halobacteriovorax marinus SJ]
MNKISIYILLTLIYLGLSKSFSPSEKRAPHVPNEKIFPSFFFGAPISIILLDSFQTGFLIKTYFQKYKIVHGFKHPETIIVRTSYSFWEKNKGNIGMSIFRRGEKKNTQSDIPMPPGILYVGDPAYGHWEMLNSGEKGWVFHRAYRHFPAIFNWGTFTPTERFYNTAVAFEEHDKTYYGDNNEFGTNGKLSEEKNQLEKEKDEEVRKTDFRERIDRLFHIPSWND